MTTTPPPAPYSTQPVGPKTNTLSIIALILGFLVPVGGIICGHIALRQIKRTGEAGHGMALAGTILGYVFTILIILGIAAYAIFIVALVGMSGTSGSFNN